MIYIIRGRHILDLYEVYNLYDLVHVAGSNLHDLQ